MWRLLAAVVAVVAGAAASAEAGVMLSKQEAIAEAFPEGVTVETVNAFLTDEQMAAFGGQGVPPPESKLFTYYRGRRDGEVVGYAVIDSHVVRTMPEAFMAVLSPDGAIDRVVLLAFYEPPEYQPSDRWLGQFDGRRLDASPWRMGTDLHGLSGATLTAHAIRDALRRILVLHKLVMRPAASP